MDTLEAISKRRSVRVFKPDPVSREMLRKIVDAGRLAPTARNEQPWEFVVVTDAAKRRGRADLRPNGPFIAAAAACIIVLAKPAQYFLEDGSAASANMLLAATGLGLGGCWVAGHGKPYASRVVSLCGAPADFKLVSMLAIGYPGESPSTEKRSLDDVVHWEAF